MARGTAILPLTLGVFLLGLAPTGAAEILPSYHFEGSYGVAAFHANGTEGGNDTRYGIVTGETEATGNTNGLFFFLSASEAVVTNALQISVIPHSEEALAEAQRTGMPVATYSDATLTFSPNSTFILLTQQSTLDFSLASDFSLGVPMDPPTRIGDSEIGMDVGASLALVGESQLTGTLVGTPAGPSSAPILWPAHPSTQVNVTGTLAGTPGRNETYTGNGYVFAIEGPAQLRVTSNATLIPFLGTVEASFRPGSDAAAKGGFDTSRLEETLQEFQSTDQANRPTLISEEIGKQLPPFAPVLNGALIGNPAGDIKIGGKTITLGDFTLLRYTSLELRPGTTENVTYSGRGSFLLAGDSLYTEKSVLGSGSFAVPVLSVILWVVAIAAIVLGFVLKPFLAPSKTLAAFPVRIVAIVFHIVAFAIAFILWDLETKAFFGVSLLTGLGSDAGATAVGIIALLQLVSFSIAGLFFGLPIRFICTTALKLVGMKSARGVGKGLGNLATWGLGAAYLPVFLNPVIQYLRDALAQGF